MKIKPIGSGFNPLPPSPSPPSPHHFFGVKIFLLQQSYSLSFGLFDSLVLIKPASVVKLAELVTLVELIPPVEFVVFTKIKHVTLNWSASLG